MDKRTTLAVLLSLLIYYGWFTMFPPPVPEEVPDGAEGAAAETVADGSDAPAAPAVTAPDATESGDPALPTPSRPPEQTRDVSLCGATGVVSTDDGALHDVRIDGYEAKYDMLPLWSWVLSGMGEAWKPYGEDPDPAKVVEDGPGLLRAGVGALDAPSAWADVRTLDGGGYEAVSRTPEGLTITRTVRVLTGEAARAPATSEADCRVEVEVTFANRSGTPWTEGAWVSVHDVLPETAPSRYSSARRPYVYVDDDVDWRDDLSDMTAPERLEGPVGWFGLADTYFGALLVPEAPEGSQPAGTAWFTPFTTEDGRTAHGVHYVLSETIPAGGELTERFVLYTGPKDIDALGAVHPLLSDAVQLGFLSFFSLPLLYLLRMIHAVLGSWALSIVGLTFLVKALFFPLTQSAFKSSQAMQAIQPDLQRVREEFKDNPQEMQKRTMELFAENGVNPVGGCLPMLAQMPVWFALYNALLSSVELYHTGFLYVRDLTEVDPYMIMPALVMGLMVLQQQFTPTGNMDPQQARIMKLMPLVIGLFFFTLPAGLMLYIFVNMTLSIAQQWYIRRTFQPQAAKPAAEGA